MPLRRTLAALSAIVIGLFISGCTIYRSDEILGSENAPAGIIYYLPKSLVTLTVMPFGKRGETRAKDEVHYVELSFPDRAKPIPAVEHVPDLTRQYVLNYNPSPLSTDHVCAGQSNGLLTGVQASAADETGNIIVSIAKLAGRLAAPAPYSTPEERLAEPDDVEIPERQFTMSLDPLDPRDRNMLADAIKRRFPAIASEGYELDVEGAEFLRGNGAPAPCPEDGICYRSAVTTRIALANRSGRRASFAYANIINRAVTGHVDVSRAFMVEKVTLLTFDKGVLSSVKVKKPSEALAVAKLPLTVVDAVMTSLLAAPGNFLANSSGFDAEQRAALVEKAVANAEKIEKLQQELEKVREGDDTVLGRVPETNYGDAFKVTCNTSG